MTDAMMKLLEDIDRNVKALLARGASSGGSSRSAAPPVADDRDLDGKYGDEEVKFSPRDWAGPSMRGRRMSQCPPEFLDALASAFDYFAKKNDANGEETDKGTPKSVFDRRAAARARGWAKRLREGWRPAGPPADDDFGRDDF